jgi:hypothetical protein
MHLSIPWQHPNVQFFRQQRLQDDRAILLFITLANFLTSTQDDFHFTVQYIAFLCNSSSKIYLFSSGVGGSVFLRVYFIGVNSHMELQHYMEVLKLSVFSHNFAKHSFHSSRQKCILIFKHNWLTNFAEA